MTDPDSPPIRVLLVDDDPTALGAMRYVLTHRAHMAVTTATGPNDALELLERATFDVVVTDVQMPGMNGLELLDELHQVSSTLPVIVVTAERGPDSAASVNDSRAAAFLHKPVDAATLIATVTDVVRPRALPVR